MPLAVCQFLFNFTETAGNTTYHSKQRVDGCSVSLSLNLNLNINLLLSVAPDAKK